MKANFRNKVIAKLVSFGTSAEVANEITNKWFDLAAKSYEDAPVKKIAEAIYYFEYR